MTPLHKTTSTMSYISIKMQERSASSYSFIALSVPIIPKFIIIITPNIINH